LKDYELLESLIADRAASLENDFQALMEREIGHLRAGRTFRSKVRNLVKRVLGRSPMLTKVALIIGDLARAK
jgi:hypothetical protein